MNSKIELPRLFGYKGVAKTLSIIAVLFTIFALAAPTLSTRAMAALTSESYKSTVSRGDTTYGWHTFYGSTTADTYGMGVAVDGAGNIYVAGQSSASWQGDTNTPPKHPYTGGVDIVVAKFNSKGEYQWHTFYGSNVQDYGIGIALDASGNIYVCGSGEATWQGDGNTNPKHPYSGGGLDAIVLKLDNNGVYQWHTFWGDMYSNDYAVGIALDSDSNIYFSGTVSGTWQGGGGADPKHPYAGDRDILAMKLDKDGVYQWHTFYGSTAFDWVSNLSIAVYGDDSIYINGYSTTTWKGDSNTDPKHSHSSSGVAYDMVVLKLNSSGTYQWHTFYGSSDVDYSLGIAVDGSGNVYVTGLSNAAWLGDSSTQPKHAYSGGNDLAVLKLDSSGVYQWHTFYGSTTEDRGSSIAASATGDIYITGYSDTTWQGDANTDPIHPHSSGTNHDIVVVRLDSNGAYRWHTFYGSSDVDHGNSIAVNPVGDIFVTGASLTTWQGDRNNNPKNAHSSSGSFYDLMLMKLNGYRSYLPLTRR